MVGLKSLIKNLLIFVGINLVSPKTVNNGLRNQHLIIEGEEWPPFLMYDLDEYGALKNCGGAMWELLLFMQKARNFTFNLVSESGYEWGTCYAVNNCTGMIGRVNRKEVDFAIGENTCTL